MRVGGIGQNIGRRLIGKRNQTGGQRIIGMDAIGRDVGREAVAYRRYKGLFAGRQRGDRRAARQVFDIGAILDFISVAQPAGEIEFWRDMPGRLAVSRETIGVINAMLVGVKPFSAALYIGVAAPPAAKAPPAAEPYWVKDWSSMDW